MTSASNQKEVANHFNVSVATVREGKREQCPAPKSRPYDLKAIEQWRQSKEPTSRSESQWKYILPVLGAIPILITSIVGVLRIFDWTQTFHGPRLELTAEYSAISVPPDFVAAVQQVEEQLEGYDGQFDDFVKQRDDQRLDYPMIAFLNHAPEEEQARAEAALQRLKSLQPSSEDGWKMPEDLSDNDIEELLVRATRIERESLRPEIESTIAKALTNRNQPERLTSKRQ